MKRLLSIPSGGIWQTTFALMLLLIVMACENDDPQPANSILVVSAGLDKNSVTGETVQLKASFNSQLSDVYNWQFSLKPDGSQATLFDADKANPFFIPDIPGKYVLELSVSRGQQKEIDDITVYAYSIASLEGNYNPVSEVNGQIKKLTVFKDKLYAMGTFTEIGGVHADYIARFDGSNWSPLGTGKSVGSLYDYQRHGVVINDMIPYKDELYVTGIFGNIGGTTSEAIARWDGSSWKSVPGLAGTTWDRYWAWAGYNLGLTMTVFRDELYVGGSFAVEILSEELATLTTIIKWDGNELAALPSVPNQYIQDLVVHDNYLYTSGYPNNFDFRNPAISVFGGAGWNNLNVARQIIVSPAENEFVISGNLIPFQEMLFIELEYWKYRENDFGEEVEVRSELVAWNDGNIVDFGPAFSLKEGNQIHTTEIFDDVLYIGGNYEGEVLGTSSRGIVTWNGQQWGVVPNGISTTISAMQEFQNKLYMAGSIGGNEIHQVVVWQPSD